MCDIAEMLKRDGWYVDSLKLKMAEFTEFTNTKEMVAELMDWDIKNFGAAAIAERLDKKSGYFEGPLVLQLANWRNISYPKIPEHDDNDGTCKLFLSDGFISVPGVQLEGRLSISGRTPYGSKVLLSGRIPYECGHLLLSNENCRLLGGNVEKVVERWKMSKLQNVAVKKVEKDATYTKFQPFSNTKMDSVTKGMKNLDVKNHQEDNSSEIAPNSKPVRTEKCGRKPKNEGGGGRNSSTKAGTLQAPPQRRQAARPARAERNGSQQGERESNGDRRNPRQQQPKFDQRQQPRQQQRSNLRYDNHNDMAGPHHQHQQQHVQGRLPPQQIGSLDPQQLYDVVLSGPPPGFDPPRLMNAFSPHQPYNDPSQGEPCHYSNNNPGSFSRVGRGGRRGGEGRGGARVFYRRNNQN